MDVVVPGMRIDPFLQGEETAQQDRRSNENGRMHEERLIRILFPPFKGQGSILGFLFTVAEYDRSPMTMDSMWLLVESWRPER